MVQYVTRLIGESSFNKIYKALEEDHNTHLLPEICYYYLAHLEQTKNTQRLLYNDSHFNDSNAEYSINFVDTGIGKYIDLIDTFNSYSPPLKVIRNLDGVRVYADLDITAKLLYPNLFSSNWNAFYAEAQGYISHYIDDGVLLLYRTFLEIPNLAGNRHILMRYQENIVQEWVSIYPTLHKFEEYDWYSKYILLLAICRKVMFVEDYTLLEN